MLTCSHKSAQKEISNRTYYLHFSERGYDIYKTDSLPLNETWKQENILDSLDIFINKKRVTILKISNYPKALIDGEFVAYYEKSLGIFYLKSTTWRSYSMLKTNNDSTNYFIDILLGNVLTNSKMFLNPEQAELINKTTESEIEKVIKSQPELLQKK
jgi:hypothetical protein